MFTIQWYYVFVALLTISSCSALSGFAFSQAPWVAVIADGPLIPEEPGAVVVQNTDEGVIDNAIYKRKKCVQNLGCTVYFEWPTPSGEKTFQPNTDLQIGLVIKWKRRRVEKREWRREEEEEISMFFYFAHSCFLLFFFSSFLLFFFFSSSLLRFFSSFLTGVR